MTIVNMGSAIAHWLGFQEKIGRSFMMNEDALKYPLSDYLVNAGNIEIKYIVLERPHPNFSNRLVDLTIVDPITKRLYNLFELKLATSHTRKQTENQRIYNDIVRLHLANRSTTDKCYFIITGKSINFQRDFKDFPSSTNGFYKKWFSFTKGQSITFNIATETDPIYVAIYTNFINKYKSNYQNANGAILQSPNSITTKCEFITAYTRQFVPYMTGIWSIS